MRTTPRKSAPIYFHIAIGFCAGVLFLAAFDSESRHAIAQGIINAFGVGYDNGVSGLQATDVQAAIDEVEGRINADETVEADLVTRINALEVAKNATPCDPNGDGVITPQEMWDYWFSMGLITTETVDNIRHVIHSMEGGYAGMKYNGVIDSHFELSYWNILYSIPLGIPPCQYPTN